MPSDLRLDDFDASGDDIKLVNEKALNWFDVSAIGTGEMLFTAGFAWIVYIASLYGIKWTIFGFIGGAVVIHCAWVAVPRDDHGGAGTGIAAILCARS